MKRVLAFLGGLLGLRPDRRTAEERARDEQQAVQAMLNGHSCCG